MQAPPSQRPSLWPHLFHWKGSAEHGTFLQSISGRHYFLFKKSLAVKYVTCSSWYPCTETPAIQSDFPDTHTYILRLEAEADVQPAACT